MTWRLKFICLTILPALLLAGFSLYASAWADNWPMWRGPRGDGSSEEQNIPTEWSAEKNIAWKVAVPGVGHASPIVWEDRIFTVSCLTGERQRIALCFDRKTGALLWQKPVLKADLEGKHELNSYASSTPATDGKRVYVSFLDGEKMLIAAYDFAGNQKWLVRPGAFSSKHGYCSSPVLFEDKVIVNGDHDGDGYLVALDAETGETLWKVDRENKTRSYCTPIIREINGRTQMILSGSKSVASYDPRTGDKHWTMGGPTEQFVASMVFNGELLFLTAGYPDLHMLAIRPDGTGNVTDTHIAWRTSKGASYVPSPVAIGEYFLVVSDAGIASCFRASDGERLWMERLGPHFSASLVTANGLAYFLSDDGTMTVVRPGPKLEVVAKNASGEYCFASPAISQGQIFLRGEKHLYAIGKK